MDSDFWSLPAWDGFEWQVEVTPDPTLRRPDGDCYTEADEEAFGDTWCYADLKVSLVHTSNPDELRWDEYLSAVEWGEMPEVSITRERLNETQVMELKAQIWDTVGVMFYEIANGAYDEFDREIEAWIVKGESGYKPIKPLDLMHGMQVGIYAKELAFDNNLSTNEKWYETRLAVFDEATRAENGLVAVHLRVDGRDYFFMSPPEHEFKVYRED